MGLSLIAREKLKNFERVKTVADFSSPKTKATQNSLDSREVLTPFAPESYSQKHLMQTDVEDLTEKTRKTVLANSFFRMDLKKILQPNII